MCSLSNCRLPLLSARQVTLLSYSAPQSFQTSPSLACLSGEDEETHFGREMNTNDGAGRADGLLTLSLELVIEMPILEMGLSPGPRVGT